jgi:selenide,water dikinase
VITGVRELLAGGMVAGGTQRNHAFVSDAVDWGDAPIDEQLLLSDAQTSGGLLLAVPADRADRLVTELQSRNTLAAARIGDVTPDAGRISVV